MYFSEQDDLEDVLSRPVKNTMLTGWFLANQTLPSAKDVTYTIFLISLFGINLSMSGRLELNHMVP